MIIEGVHLTPRFMFSMMKKYPYVIPFTICIEKESKHKQRFAVRSKYMTLDKKKNKYIQYISNIRMIQAWFMEKSDEHLIPKINNVNIDKSVNIIHRIVTTYVRKMINDQMSVVPDKSVKALKLYRSYNKVIKPIINTLQLDQEVNKNIVMQKFLDNFENEENEANINNNINVNQDNIINNKGSIIKNNQIMTNNIEIIDTSNPNNEQSKSNSNFKIFNNENSIRSDCVKNNSSENDGQSIKLNQNVNIADDQQKNALQLNSFNISIDSNIINQSTNQKVQLQNQTFELNIINKSSSSSTDIINLDLQIKKQNSQSQNIHQNINQQDLLYLPKEEPQSINVVSDQKLNNQNEIEQNVRSKDPNILLNQFLNDLENKHPKSFVEYTIKKIEDIKQTALKKYKQSLPAPYQSDFTPKIHNKIEQNQTPKNKFINAQCKENNPLNKVTSIQQNNQTQFKSANEIQNEHQISNFSSHQLNNDKIQISMDSEHLSTVQQPNPDFFDQNINQIEIKLNDQLIINQDEQLKETESKQNNLNTNLENQPQLIEDKIKNPDIIQPIKKKKLKMDEKSNQVTLHSSQNEEQTYNEIQSEGDSLRMGEDNYQFDVLSEGEEEEEDPNNQEEESNSIDDDEEEADYIDNFENQTDESSDEDEETKNNQHGNEDDEYEEEEEDEEEDEQEIIINQDRFKYRIGDVVHELDPEYLKILNYDDCSNYIKSIEQIVEATVNLQKLKDQNENLQNVQIQQKIKRKKLHLSKSQLFNQENEGKIIENNDIRKKIRMQSGKYDRQHSYNKQSDIKTQQSINSSYHITQNMNFSKKRQQKSNRTSRKNTSSYTLIQQKNGLSTYNNDHSPIPLEKRTKSCEPQTNLHLINFKKQNNVEDQSHSGDDIKKQKQNSQDIQYDIKLERVDSESTLENKL